jgi:hypothetical protein
MAHQAIVFRCVQPSVDLKAPVELVLGALACQLCGIQQDIDIPPDGIFPLLTQTDLGEIPSPPFNHGMGEMIALFDIFQNLLHIVQECVSGGVIIHQRSLRGSLS